MTFSLETVTAALSVIMMLAGAATWLLTRREAQARSWAGTFSDMAETVAGLSQALDQERERRRAIEDSLGELRIKLNEYERGIRILIRQLRRAGIVPEWRLGDD